MIYRCLIAFLILINFQNSIFSQSRKISTFDLNDPSIAVKKAFKSQYDTLIFDAHYPVWELIPIRLVGIHGKTVLFEPKVVLKAKKGAYPKKTDALLKFIDCTDISLLGSHNVLAMNKEEYLDGEWRHVIRLRGCTDVVIKDLELRDSGGDGLTIGRSEKKLYSQNIYVSGIVSDNNKRQGLSIVSGRNILIENSIFKNTAGTFPGAGVDLEPDLMTEFLDQIEFKNCTFIGNYNAGIKIAAGKLIGNSEAVSIKFKECIIENNFSPDNPKVKGEIVILSHKTDPVGGEVVFEDCVIRNSQWRFLFARKSGKAFRVDFKNCLVENINQSDEGAAVFLEVPHYKELSTIGGYNFNNLTLDSGHLNSFIFVRGSGRGTLDKVQDIYAKVILKNGAELPDINYLKYNPSRNENVNIEVSY